MVSTGTIAFNLSADPGNGYYVYGSDGSLQGFGNTNYLSYLGTLAFTPLNQPVVGMAATPDGAGTGWWPPMVASSPSVTPASTDRLGSRLNEPIVGMAATPDGKGYWLVASDGGVFSYGDASFYGSMGGTRSTSRSSAWRHHQPAVTGWWLVTEASSPLATHRSTVRRATSHSTSRSSA